MSKYTRSRLVELAQENEERESDERQRLRYFLEERGIPYKEKRYPEIPEEGERSPEYGIGWDMPDDGMSVYVMWHEHGTACYVGPNECDGGSWELFPGAAEVYEAVRKYLVQACDFCGAASDPCLCDWHKQTTIPDLDLHN